MCSVDQYGIEFNCRIVVVKPAASDRMPGTRLWESVSIVFSTPITSGTPEVTNGPETPVSGADRFGVVNRVVGGRDFISQIIMVTI